MQLKSLRGRAAKQPVTVLATECVALTPWRNSEVRGAGPFEGHHALQAYAVKESANNSKFNFSALSVPSIVTTIGD